MSKADFRANQLLIDAVVRNIEIVGEASNRIYKQHREFRDAHPEGPLRAPSVDGTLPVDEESYTRMSARTRL
ncbi:HepT-like ribonuclease domain-containing protein [Trinickia sp. NRRL B-1857]